MEEGVEHEGPDDVVESPEFGFGGADACEGGFGDFGNGKGNGGVEFGGGEFVEGVGRKVVGAREAEPRAVDAA